MVLNDLILETVRYGPDEILKLCTYYCTPLGEIITQQDHVKDLGVMLSSDGTFDHHINKIIESAKSTVAWILRTFSTRDKTTMLTLWKSMVIPILEYCSVLWSPLKKGYIQKIEALQWSFVRKIRGLNLKSYWDALKEICFHFNAGVNDTKYCTSGKSWKRRYQTLMTLLMVIPIPDLEEKFTNQLMKEIDYL